MNFETELEKKVNEAQEIIRSYLPDEDGPQHTVLSAMNYSVLAGGKRLRPILMKETYLLFGGKSKVIEPFMAAMEFIHTSSLVHDDLPAIDNDEYRRGKKTTHAAYGEDMALLAGDALLNYAYETAVKAFSSAQDETVGRIQKALQILTEKAGIFGMLGGQAVDVESEHKQVDLDTVRFIHKKKTAALIEGSMMIGAALGGADEKELTAVEQIAENVGIAFQIRDDILDVTSTTQVLGKPVGSDERNEKATYVSLRGLQASEKDVEELSQKAVQLLDELGREDAFLRELILRLIDRRM